MRAVDCSYPPCQEAGESCTIHMRVRDMILCCKGSNTHMHVQPVSWMLFASSVYGSVGAEHNMTLRSLTRTRASMRVFVLHLTQGIIINIPVLGCTTLPKRTHAVELACVHCISATSAHVHHALGLSACPPHLPHQPERHTSTNTYKHPHLLQASVLPQWAGSRRSSCPSTRNSFLRRKRPSGGEAGRRTYNSTPAWDI